MFDIEDIRQARFMRFHSLPSSNNAEKFAQALVEVVEAQEQRQRARKAKDEREFQQAVRHTVPIIGKDNPVGDDKFQNNNNQHHPLTDFLKHCLSSPTGGHSISRGSSSSTPYLNSHQLLSNKWFFPLLSMA